MENNATRKNDAQIAYSFFYLLFLYLGVKLLPLEEWISNEIISMSLLAVLLLGVLYLGIKECKKAKVSFFKPLTKKNVWLLPLLLGCLVNFLFVWCFSQKPEVNINGSNLAFDILNGLIGAGIEEIIFRGLALSFFLRVFSKRWELKSILLSALLFSLMHTINFLGNPYMNVVVQLGYTFIMGLILGVVDVVSDSLIFPYIGHLCFNLFNMTLFSVFYQLEITWQYVLFCSVFSALLLIYAFWVYHYSRKKEKDAPASI